jgi:transposase
MGKPYSDDLRERVVAAIEAGHTRVKVAERYNMALSTVGGFIKRKRERAVSVQTSSAGTRLSRLSHIQIGLRNLWRNNRIARLQNFKFAWRKKR